MGKQIQVVDAAGCYQTEAVQDLVRSRGIADAGVRYSTVAIMGPQSSGKSTLLNHVVRTRPPIWLVPCIDFDLRVIPPFPFPPLLRLCLRLQPVSKGRGLSRCSIRLGLTTSQAKPQLGGATVHALCAPHASARQTGPALTLQFGTDFKMMDAVAGRSQTTRGVWLDVSSEVTDPPTMVMDLEGSDGRERGEDDTTFERQSALFALATADVLMINTFEVNIGRVQGSGAPLLKTIFQVQPPCRARAVHAPVRRLASAYAAMPRCRSTSSSFSPPPATGRCCSSSSATVPPRRTSACASICATTSMPFGRPLSRRQSSQTRRWTTSSTYSSCRCRITATKASSLCARRTSCASASPLQPASPFCPQTTPRCEPQPQPSRAAHERENATGGNGSCL